MKTLKKALVSTVAAGAMALSTATPAMARDRHDDGIDAGDVIAGALIIGGIAAVAAAASNGDRYDRDYRYRDRNYRGYRDNYYRSYGSPRSAVEYCVRAAEREARRYGYRYADVTQIRDVDDRRHGWRVKGRIQVDGGRGYYNRGRYDRYDRRGYDTGSFKCDIRGGRVVDLDFSGVRGLR
jgi:hypothetical protein